MKKTVTTIKNENREKMVVELTKILQDSFGENVVKVGDSEFSIYIGDSDENEKMFVNIDIKSKEFRDRKTTKKEFFAYNGFDSAKEYENSLVEKAEKAKTQKELKQKKNLADKLAREQKKLAKIQELKEKALQYEKEKENECE